MTKLDQLEAELRHMIGQSSAVRPFVCNGSPLECTAFIVGFNPATEMTADFWSFWVPGHGFDKAAWFEAYKSERLDKAQRLGKQRRAVSNSRRVIEWIIQEAAPVSILETNIFALPTEQARDLATADKKTLLFDTLFEHIKPRVIVTHGNQARAELATRETTAIVFGEKHFSRGWSQADARALGRRIRLACGDAS
jgi:hypothetical protein